jgi:hypothetical protein
MCGRMAAYRQRDIAHDIIPPFRFEFSEICQSGGAAQYVTSVEIWASKFLRG